IRAWAGSSDACAVSGTLQQCYAQYTFTPNGQKDSVLDANGNLTDYAYDGFDRLASTVFPSPTTPGSTNPSDHEDMALYDANGNLQQKRTRNGDWIVNTFDALNRLTQSEDHLGSLGGTLQRQTNTVYDLAGRETSLSDNLGHSIASAYDAAKRLSTVTIGGPQWPVGVTKLVSYQYDAASNRTRVTWPDGWYVQYCYDALNRMSGAAQNGDATCTTGKIAAYTYDPLSRRTGLTYDTAGANVSYSYSNAGDLLTLVNNLTGTTDDNSNTLVSTPAHQLARDTNTNTAWMWAYPATNTTSYTPNGLNQYASVAGTGYSYDGNGSLTGDGTWTYAYDIQNRLTTATKSGTSASYIYDPR